MVYYDTDRNVRESGFQLVLKRFHKRSVVGNAPVRNDIHRNGVPFFIIVKCVHLRDVFLRGNRPGDNPLQFRILAISGRDGVGARLGLGFHVSGFFDKVLDIEHCHLQREPSNAIRLFIKQYAVEHGLSFFDLREQKGFLRNITVRTASTGEVMLLVAFGPEALEKGAKKRMSALLDAIAARFPEITSLYYVVNPKCNDALGDLSCTQYAGNEAIYEQMESLRFKIGPKSFYQTNSAQAYRLYSVVRDSVREAKDSLQMYNNAAGGTWKPVIYDLYTGTGTIALFLSSLAAKVIGIEYVPEAIEDAKVNAAENGITNAEFVAGDMKDILTREFIEAHGAPDIVVLDPPRAGIHPDVAQVLLEAAPKRMVYVSCNPATQARDLAIFAPQYDIDFVQPVDMFPHTTHVENVVSLVRK